MSKLLMLKGLPASGKSTYARELVEQGWKRINKDDLRAMIDSSKWSKANENQITEARDLLAIQYLDEGYNVVIDDTNFADIHAETLAELADNCDAEFEEMFFDVPVMECVERDAKRGDKSVGVEVIMRMYNQYLKPKPIPYNKDLPQAFIFDIDGTLAKMHGRSPYDWGRVQEDFVNEPIANILDALIQGRENYHILIVSGRDGVCKQETIDWLNENDIAYSELFMRPEGDSRKDTIIKQEIYENNIKDKYNVVAVIDDRNCVVDMWRSLGLTCLQCDYGYF